MKNKGWHITDDGSVKKCSADKQPCHYDKHFKSEKLANMQAKLDSAFSSTSRTVRNNNIKNVSNPMLSSIEFVKKLPPQIYAFIVPELAEGLHATKVGDTTRGVEVRLREWRQKGGIYENLKLQFNIDASFEDSEGNTIYVRDYNFHVWLKNQGYTALVEVLDEYPHLKDIPEGVSQEFYFHQDNREEEITEKMLIKSLQHQKENYGRPASPYAYYREIRGQQVSAHYAPVNDYEMRPFQAEIVNKATNYFNNTTESDPQFLLSAPTRSGKSFMAANTVSQLFETSSKENNCVVVVSGFAEIEDEWKATFESHKKFAKEDGEAHENKCGVSPCECKNRFKYLSVSDLRRDKNAVKNAYAEGYANVAVFLTLQDLSGSTKDEDGVKEVHEFLEEEGSVDFLIGDEAHFAMFSGGRYQDSIKKGENDDEALDGDPEDMVEASKMLGTMHPTQGKLFVTATPYNNVPWGTKYNQSVNAAVIRESEILKEKDKWDEANAEKEVPAAEWANPSYGLPDKKMFGVDVGMSPNELFRMQGTRFANETKVREFIQGFFGASPTEGNVPNFFGSKEFADAGLGNHIYATLPSRKACDAFEAELKKVFNSRGMSEYEVLNISSNKPRHATSRKRAAEIKDDITRFAEAGKKTITVTCNRMGTGVTQEYWDTVLLLRTMSSAQQFQQTAGRPGTPHVSSRNNMSEKVRNNKRLCRNCESNEIRAIGKFLCESCFISGGAELESAKQDKTLKHIEKPNVAVISLDPGQLVKIRQEAILAEMVVDPDREDSDEVNRITDEELAAIPLYLTSENGYELEKVTASNIMEHFLSHLKTQGVMEMVTDLSVNRHNITPQLAAALNEKYTSLENTPKVFETGIVEGDYKAKTAQNYCIRDDCDLPVKAGITPGGYPYRLCDDHYAEAKEKNEAADDEFVGELPALPAEDEEAGWKEVEGRVRNAYVAILLYSVLSQKPLTGIDSILRSSEEYEGSRRLARHLELDLNIMKALKYDGVSGRELDNRVKLLNELSRDTTLNQAWERLTLALNSFKKFSNNEVPTPEVISEKLVQALRMDEGGYEKLARSSSGIIDIGSKSAINLVQLHKQAEENGEDISQKLWSIPTSGKTYELTRRVYKDYDWDLDKIIYHDNLDNLETVQLVHLLTERNGCQAKDPSTCKYHGSINGTEALKTELKELRDKMEDDKEFDRISEKMKNVGRFDFCISNPPYQKAPTTKNQNRSTEIYPQFIELGAKLSDCSVMVHPLKAFRGVPKIPSESTRNIMESEEFSVEHVEQDASNFFPTVRIKGGVAITRYERGTKNTVAWEKIGIPEEALDILKRVNAKHKDSDRLSNRMHPKFIYTDEVLTKYGLRKSTGIHSSHPREYPELILTSPPEGDYVTLHGNLDNKRAVLYVKSENISETSSKLAKGYKVLIPGAIGSGKFGEPISETIVTDKNSVSTRTYTNIGPFATKSEATAVSQYLKTRFARMLLSTKKLTHNTPIHMFDNIPQQDFTKHGDIDWTVSVDDIDAQLFKKYGFNNKQIKWVNDNVAGM